MLTAALARRLIRRNFAGLRNFPLLTRNVSQLTTPPSTPSSSEESSSSSSGESSSDELDDEFERQRSLRVAIIGAPNAGKSVLTNMFVGSKVSAVSDKTNTTVRETLGICSRDVVQIVFQDTPGVVDPRSIKGESQRSRVKGAWGTAINCDMLLFLVDAHRQMTRPDPRIPRLLRNINPGLQQHTTAWSSIQKIPSILVLNKIDLLDKSDHKRVDELKAHLELLHEFDRSFVISAKHKLGTEEVLAYMTEQAVSRPWAFSETAVTNRSPEQRAVEIVREEVFRRLHQELPYVVEVKPVSFHQIGGNVKIAQEIWVNTFHQGSIVVGKGGENILKINEKATASIGKALGKDVKLNLVVKSRKG